MEITPLTSENNIKIDMDLLKTMYHRLQACNPSNQQRQPSSCSIYPVPHEIRLINVDAYTPKVVCIGPYHDPARTDSCYREMQCYKWQCLHFLLSRQIQIDDQNQTQRLMERCLEAMSDCDTQVRSCYSRKIDLDRSRLAAMMMLDGCFILPLLLRHQGEDFAGFYKNHAAGRLTTWNLVKLDLLMLENQIPFFIIDKVRECLCTQEDKKVDLGTEVLRLFDNLLPQPQRSPDHRFAVMKKETRSSTEIHHLLYLVYKSLLVNLPSGSKTKSTTQMGQPLTSGEYEFSAETSGEEDLSSEEEEPSEKTSGEDELSAKTSKTEFEIIPDSISRMVRTRTTGEDDRSSIRSALHRLTRRIRRRLKFCCRRNVRLARMARPTFKEVWLDKIKKTVMGDDKSILMDRSRTSGQVIGGDELSMHDALHRLSWIPSATELRVAGVKFKKSENPDSFLNIVFSRGVMKIPPLQIFDDSKYLFANLIAFEQCHPDTSFHIAVYAAFMDCLIASSEDGRLLHLSGILINRMSSDQDPVHFFSQICKGIHYNADRSYLRHVFENVLKYHENTWHKWRAGLVRDYFSNPWSIFVVIASVVLFIFTFLQTFFAIFSYFKPSM